MNAELSNVWKMKSVFFFFSTDDPAEADLWLLNSCTVKNPAEDHFRNSIKYWIPNYFSHQNFYIKLFNYWYLQMLVYKQPTWPWHCSELLNGYFNAHYTHMSRELQKGKYICINTVKLSEKLFCILINFPPAGAHPHPADALIVLVRANNDPLGFVTILSVKLFLAMPVKSTSKVSQGLIKCSVQCKVFTCWIFRFFTA